MTPKITLWCTFQFEAWHCWPDAPEKFSYLANKHRHIFHGRAEWRVTNPDRELEFIDLKHQALEAVDELLNKGTMSWSCEQWAINIANAIHATSVTISEDGENGATVEIDNQ